MHDHPVEITIFDAEQFRDEWIPVLLSEAIGFLDEKLNLIPVEHRGTAMLAIEGTSDHDTPIATIKITYSRPPTAAEIEERRQKYIAREEWQADYLARQLEIQRARVADLKS